MKTLDAIRLKGFEIAQKHGLISLPELRKIPTSDDIIADFIEIQIEDLSDFLTIMSFSNFENLFVRAFMYTYGKGAEFALSHLMNTPLNRIGYNFDECMTGTISNLIPIELKHNVNKYSVVMLEMYSEMFALTKGSQEKIISEGDNFGKAILVILNGAFYFGTRTILSQEIRENLKIDFSVNNEDIKYDYDNYNQNYNESDYPYPIN
jgi:hypothetical protein